MLMLPFFSILPALHKQDTFVLALNFEVGHFTPHVLLLSFFLWCCYERNSFHTASLSHFISLVCPAHYLFFLSSQGWLLDSHKRWLFCLHIQHTTHCLFEQRALVSSLEAAVCGFCLSISQQSLCRTLQSLRRTRSGRSQCCIAIYMNMEMGEMDIECS